MPVLSTINIINSSFPKPKEQTSKLAGCCSRCLCTFGGVRARAVAIQPPPHIHTPIPSASQTGQHVIRLLMPPAASDISRLSRATERGIIPHRTGEEQEGTTGRRLASPGKDSTTATWNSPGAGPVSQGSEAAPSGLQQWWPSGPQARLKSSLLTATPKQPTACLCSSALLPLPSPPSALHPQTQKHSSPGLSPAACSSPGFAAQCKASQSC